MKNAIVCTCLGLLFCIAAFAAVNEREEIVETAIVQIADDALLEGPVCDPECILPKICCDAVPGLPPGCAFPASCGCTGCRPGFICGTGGCLCHLCLSDVNNDGEIDIVDWLRVLNNYGDCPDELGNCIGGCDDGFVCIDLECVCNPCEEDVNDDGTVDVDDLDQVDEDWGSCSG